MDGIKSNRTHEVGDVWEDDHYKYEKKDGYTVKSGKNSEILKIFRNLSKLDTCNNKSCKHVGKFSETHKKSIKQFGYCIDCMINRT